MSNCTYCSIVDKQLNSYKVYEDRKILAFLDIYPLTKGHTLIITKKHYENIFEVPADELKQLILIAKKIAELTKSKLGATGINILSSSSQAGRQSINHFHIHLIPRYDDDTLDLTPKSNYNEPKFNDVLNQLLS